MRLIRGKNPRRGPWQIGTNANAINVRLKRNDPAGDGERGGVFRKGSGRPELGLSLSLSLSADRINNGPPRIYGRLGLIRRDVRGTRYERNEFINPDGITHVLAQQVADERILSPARRPRGRRCVGFDIGTKRSPPSLPRPSPSSRIKWHS